MASLLDFLKTKSDDNQNKNQFDWGGKIIPLAMMIGGAGANLMSGYQQGRQNVIDQKRQANLDEWNKMIQDEQLKKLQRENATVDITPAMGEQFKGTKYEPFIWNPGETKTQSTQDYLSSLGITNPGGTNLTGQITTEKPESLKTTSMNKQEYLNMVNDIEAQKAAKNAADLKAMLEQQKSENQAAKDAEGKRRWEAEQNLAWYNATKGQDQTKKDPLLLGYKDLGAIVGKKDKYGAPDTTAKDALSNQYSSAIRSNINDPEKVQQYIDRYNFLNGTGYTYENWVKQAQKEYNPANNRPLIANKSNTQSNKSASIEYNGVKLPANTTQAQLNALLKEAQNKKISFVQLIRQKYPELNG